MIAWGLALLAKLWALVPGFKAGGVAVTWVKDGVVWVVSGLYGSAKAALSAPATYPIIGAVALAAYFGGHHMGAKPAHGLQTSLSKVTMERDRLTVEFRAAKSEVAQAEQCAKDAEDKADRLRREVFPKPDTPKPPVRKRLTVAPAKASPEPVSAPLSWFKF